MCTSCDWEDYNDLCDEMLTEDKYDFAAETIESIQNWIIEKEHITERQKAALDNINGSVE